MESLSRRGSRLVGESPMPEYILEHFTRSASDHHVSLCVAENKLMGDLLLPRLSQLPEPPERVLGYDAMVGNTEFRGRLATFMAKHFLGRRFDASEIAVLAGAGTVLENVFYALADEGDAVLVPTPSYAGFWADLETRDALHIVPADCASADGFQLDTDRLEAAYAGSDRPVKALLFTNPDNPTGRVATPEAIESVLAWAAGHDLHVVFDEIYALSVFGETPFTSVAALRPELGDRVHIVWAFSKDFGASGLRCGLLVSENRALLDAVGGLAYWGAVSGHTQWMLDELIADEAWVGAFCTELRERLRGTYTQVSEALSEVGIPHIAADGGIFVVCDLRAYLSEPTADAERALWKRILDGADVNLTPGAACRIAEPGFMRLCYAAQPLEVVLEGIERVGAVLR